MTRPCDHCHTDTTTYAAVEHDRTLWLCVACHEAWKLTHPRKAFRWFWEPKQEG